MTDPTPAAAKIEATLYAVQLGELRRGVYAALQGTLPGADLGPIPTADQLAVDVADLRAELITMQTRYETDVRTLRHERDAAREDAAGLRRQVTEMTRRNVALTRELHDAAVPPPGPREETDEDLERRAIEDGEAETHELYSWDARNRGWLAVAQGTEEAMTAMETARYQRARANGRGGAAFWVGEIDDGAPQLAPSDLGVEVTGA